MSNVAGLHLIYGVTDVLNCQSKLILKVIQGHQGEKSQLRVTTHKSKIDSQMAPSKDSFRAMKYQRLTSTTRYTYASLRLLKV